MSQPKRQIPIQSPLQMLQNQLNAIVDRMDLLNHLQDIELKKEYPSVRVLDSYLAEIKACHQQIELIEDRMLEQRAREIEEQTRASMYDLLEHAPFEEHDAIQDFFRAVDENTRRSRK